MVKKFVFLFLAALTGKWTQAQYRPADAGSSVQFKIKNLGFNINGSFTGLQGSIRFDPMRPADAGFEVSVDAATVNTDNSLRDTHLRNEDYFDVKNYPLIRLVSTKITAANKANTFLMSGKLTIRDRTKDVSFPFTATRSGGSWLFAGTFRINRRDFNVGGAGIIADNLDISLNVFAKQ